MSDLSASTTAAPTSTATPARTRPAAVSVLLAILGSTVLGSLLGIGVSAVAVAAGADPTFGPLGAPAIITLTLLGATGGAIGWAIIRGRARDPRRVLSILVPTLFLLSLVPDLLLGLTRSFPGTTWTGVGALMVMHVLVTGCVVAANQLFQPVRRIRD